MREKRNNAPRFRTLDTESGDAPSRFPEDHKEAARLTAAYLSHVAHGGVGGKPLCPFTPRVMARNGFRLGVVAEMPSDPELDDIARSVGDELVFHSPGDVGYGIPTDFKAVAACFAHPSCRSEKFYERLKETHARVRLGFLERGQMVSAMFETHPDPSGNRAFNSSVPLLIARRMSQRDGIFMKTPEAQEVFEKFFPPTESVTVPNTGFGNPDLPCTCTQGQPVNPNCMRHGRRNY